MLEIFTAICELIQIIPVKDKGEMVSYISSSKREEKIL